MQKKFGSSACVNYYNVFATSKYAHTQLFFCQKYPYVVEIKDTSGYTVLRAIYLI